MVRRSRTAKASRTSHQAAKSRCSSFASSAAWRRWKQYIAALTATLEPYHVKTLARAPAVAIDASTPPAGSTVILTFNSVDDIKAFWNSAAYQAIIPLREKSARTIGRRVHLAGGFLMKAVSVSPRSPPAFRRAAGMPPATWRKALQSLYPRKDESNGLSEITVKTYRGEVVQKMAARTFADLGRMANALGLRGS